MSLYFELSLEFAVAENLNKLLAVSEVSCLELLESDLSEVLLLSKLLESRKVYCEVILVVDVLETSLRKLAEEKNLTKIGLEELQAARLTNGKVLVKVLGNGELKAKLEVEAHAFSKSAEEAIKAVGGNTTII